MNNEGSVKKFLLFRYKGKLVIDIKSNKLTRETLTKSVKYVQI